MAQNEPVQPLLFDKAETGRPRHQHTFVNIQSQLLNNDRECKKCERRFTALETDLFWRYRTKVGRRVEVSKQL